MKVLFNGSISEFKIFTDTELKLYKWIIYDMNIHDRYEKVKIYSYIDKLEESVRESGFDLEYIHTGPVISREQIFATYSPDTVRKVL